MSKDKKHKNTENIKDTAGAAFHTVHRALETTEDLAMSALDATANAIDNVTDRDDKKDNQK